MIGSRASREHIMFGNLCLELDCPKLFSEELKLNVSGHFGTCFNLSVINYPFVYPLMFEGPLMARRQ
jgi:hypothetical protein